MRPPSTLSLGSRGFLRATVQTVAVGSPFGPPTNYKGDRVMSVRARINGREFTLSWEEFEKALHRNNIVGGEFEVLAIYAGGRPC